MAGAITSQNGTAPKLQALMTTLNSSAITSQNGTAPKLCIEFMRMRPCAITSQNGTAPKRKTRCACSGLGAITSQNGTAPKHDLVMGDELVVRLPVRTALLQNRCTLATQAQACDYQSERHCSKTQDPR